MNFSSRGSGPSRVCARSTDLNVDHAIIDAPDAAGVRRASKRFKLGLDVKILAEIRVRARGFEQSARESSAFDERRTDTDAAGKTHRSRHERPLSRPGSIALVLPITRFRSIEAPCLPNRIAASIEHEARRFARGELLHRVQLGVASKPRSTMRLTQNDERAALRPLQVFRQT